MMGSHPLACAGLEEVIKRSIMALCEVNIQYQHHLEVLGCILVRSDNAPALNFLLQERVTNGPTVMQGVSSASPPAARRDEPSNRQHMPLDIPSDTQDDVIMQGRGSPSCLKSTKGSLKNIGITRTPICHRSRKSSTPKPLSPKTQRLPAQAVSHGCCSVELPNEHLEELPINDQTSNSPGQADGLSVDFSSLMRTLADCCHDRQLQDYPNTDGESSVAVKVEPVCFSITPQSLHSFTRTRHFVETNNPSSSWPSNHGDLDSGQLSFSPKHHVTSPGTGLRPFSPDVLLKPPSFRSPTLSANYLPTQDGNSWLGSARASRRKQFECSTCGMVLANKNNLRNHINSAHTHSRLYVCHLCQRVHYSAQALSMHRRRHHRNVPPKYVCTTCGKMYKIKSDLSAHACKLHVFEDNGRKTMQASNGNKSAPSVPTADSTVFSPENSQSEVSRGSVVALEVLATDSMAPCPSASCSESAQSTVTQAVTEAVVPAAVLSIPNINLIRCPKLPAGIHDSCIVSTSSDTDDNNSALTTSLPKK